MEPKQAPFALSGSPKTNSRTRRTKRSSATTRCGPDAASIAAVERGTLRPTPSRLFIVLAALLAGGCALIFTSDTSGPEARRLVSGGAKLIDVRSPEEFADGHLEGAVNIPVAQLEARLGEVGPKDAPVVVYCRSGHRASKAKQVLEAAGFKAVHNLGPKSYW